MNSESVKQITEFFFYSVIYRTNNTQFTNHLKQTFMTFFVALKNMCKFSYGVIFFGFQKEIRKSVVFVL